MMAQEFPRPWGHEEDLLSVAQRCCGFRDRSEMRPVIFERGE
jgi:hypothetical protein